MRKILHYLALLLALVVGLHATAAAPSSYYNNAKNKSDQALMTALHNIIKGIPSAPTSSYGPTSRQPTVMEQSLLTAIQRRNTPIALISAVIIMELEIAITVSTLFLTAGGAVQIVTRPILTCITCSLLTDG